jgi:hypothetical protein
MPTPFMKLAGSHRPGGDLPSRFRDAARSTRKADASVIDGALLGLLATTQRQCSHRRSTGDEWGRSSLFALLLSTMLNKTNSPKQRKHLSAQN